MDLNNYKKILKAKGIKLFDYQYRLSFFKINLATNNNYNFDNQIGGGNKKILKNKNKKELINIVSYSLSKNVNLGYIHHLLYT